MCGLWYHFMMHHQVKIILACYKAKSDKIMALSLSEISVLLEQKISKSYSKLNVDQVGRVLSIGDGIARVYG